MKMTTEWLYSMCAGLGIDPKEVVSEPTGEPEPRLVPVHDWSVFDSADALPVRRPLHLELDGPVRAVVMTDDTMADIAPRSSVVVVATNQQAPLDGHYYAVAIPAPGGQRLKTVRRYFGSVDCFASTETPPAMTRAEDATILGKVVQVVREF